MFKVSTTSHYFYALLHLDKIPIAELKTEGPDNGIASKMFGVVITPYSREVARLINHLQH